MPNKWKEVRLGDITSIRRGSSPRPIVNFITDEGMPWVKIADATENDSKYINSTKQYLKQEGVCKSVIVEPGDLILSNSGTAGLPKFMGITACIHDGWQVFKDLDGISSEFLYYSLVHMRQRLLHGAYDSTMKNLTLDMVRDAKIFLPELSEQHAVTDILSTLDKKIELNRQTNQTLEQMAQALFKSWFVDFDPIFDNALASGMAVNDFPETLQKKAEQRQQVQQEIANGELDAKPLPEDIQQLFPSEFEQSNEPSTGINGWIPKGWQAGSLSSIAKFTSERIEGVDLTLENYISTDNMLSNRGGVEKASKLPSVKTTPAFKIGDILVSNIRPYFKKIWFASHNGGRSNDVLGFEALNTDSKEYLLNLLYQDAFFDFMMTTAKGSKMPRGDKKAIMDWGLSIPPSNLQEYFSKFVSNYYQVIPIRNKETDALASLRDTLLPKLISGELTINKEVA